jgi:hypothetical protein
MRPLAIACIIFACTLVGTLLGMWVGRAVPENHLSGDSKDSVKQALGLIATLTALVIGLLVAATKGTFDAQGAAVKELATNVALLDRVLNRYGRETKESRELLRTVVSVTLESMWPEGGGRADVVSAESRAAGEAMFDKIAALDAKNDAQRLLKTRALEISINLAQTRQRLLAQKESSIPAPFVIVLSFWLTILFTCYGMLAPRNLTVVVCLVVCMLSVSGALFLVLEMDRPFDGEIMRVSSAPLRGALSRMGD